MRNERRAMSIGNWGIGDLTRTMIATILLSLSLFAGNATEGGNAKDGIRRVDIGVDEAGDEWENAYQLQTKHYVFRTDLPETEGRRIARNLDMLYKAFFAEFSGIIDDRNITEKMIVYFYNDVKRYESAIKKVHPGMEKSDGFLNTQDNIAHLFRIETRLRNAVVPDMESTYHECAHQIMSKVLSGYNKCAERPQFWAVEAIACWFETLEVREDGYTIGKRRPSRFQIIPQFKDAIAKIKIKEYTDWDQKALLNPSANPQANYLLASILAYVLCGEENGRYRKEFLSYVREVNNGKGTKTLFEETITMDVATLEAKVREHLEPKGSKENE